MSDFDKKKSTTNDKKNSNINIDNIDEDAYEIPDIVSSGKKSNKMEDKKEKKKKPEHTQKHVFENRLHHHKKEKEKTDILEDLEFISEESVKDKSRMAEGKPISHEFVSKKKTLRRSVDAREAKKEKSVAFMRRNIAFVGIGCLVVVVGVCAIVIGVKSMKAKKAAANKNQALSSQEYETDQNEEINTLMENYYSAYVSGNTGEMIEFANPISDKEKSYISMYSQYIEKYNNITCYTKAGADDNSYIVIAAFDIKYKNVDTAAPGLDCFYIKTNEQGKYYIDNVYSPFNMSYQENPIDDTIRQLIADFQNGSDIIALQANVQTRYEDAVNADENLKNMVEVTIPNAVSEWEAQQQQLEAQKAQEAANQVAQQDQTDQQVQQPDTTVPDQQVQQPEVTQPDQTQTPVADTTEVEQKAWVYATETMNIRQEPNEQSAVLASAFQGSELRQLAVTANGWVKVKTGDIVGYVKSEYITTQQQ
ncbi:MAG: SH3 domain-containing protein [Lachnospiraceae bacterium]|nr:SH3 domain-containing protein [Lachnospiraceae bacterium]